MYRTSEGVENLGENYRTFDACVDIFKKNGIVTIFSEGKCINEWHLRPLKKGTARLAVKAWEDNIPLKVLPVGINYSSFTRFGKNVFLNFGEPIDSKDIDLSAPDGSKHQQFNNKLRQQLELLVYEIPKESKEKLSSSLELKPSLTKKVLLGIPATIGWFIHAPLYLPLKRFTWKRTHDNDHYDSVLTGILLLAYPFYIIIIIGSLLLLTGWYAIFLLLLFPFTAWAYIQLKPQLD